MGGSVRWTLIWTLLSEIVQLIAMLPGISLKIKIWKRKYVRVDLFVCDPSRCHFFTIFEKDSKWANSKKLQISPLNYQLHSFDSFCRFFLSISMWAIFCLAFWERWRTLSSTRSVMKSPCHIHMLALAVASIV